MAGDNQATLLATLSKKSALTEAECRTIAQMRGARELKLAPGVTLPDAAFATPGKTLFLTLERVTLTARHLRDLAKWPSLVQMHIQTCRVDESALHALAGAKKLTDLWLEDTNVSDAGLADVGQITKLRWLTLGGTNVTDRGLAHLMNLHDLRILWLDRTKVTDAGLMQLAHLTRLSALNTAGSNITDAGKEAFFEAQQANIKAARNATRKARAASPADDPAALEAAKNVFLDFSREMAAWEAACMAEADPNDFEKMTEADLREHRARQQAACAAIFAKYCTPQPRKYGRPNVIHYGSPSHYDARQQHIDSVEFDTPRRIYITVTHRAYGKSRYAIVKKQDGWRVDNAQVWSGGWQSHGL